MASRLTTSTTAAVSVRSVLRNFSRAGVAAKSARASIRVPRGQLDADMPRFSPASTRIEKPCGASLARVSIERSATAAMEGSASPRKPSVAIAVRSPSGIFEVAWRSMARARSRSSIPQPSSITRMSLRPPPSIATSMRVAPASSAFSTSSFTADAGRSTTSPAAMRSTRIGSRRRTGIKEIQR